MTNSNSNLAGQILNTNELASGFAAVITGQGLISVTGEDAATFLHSQLTNDVTHLGPQEVRLAGYCSPKGRLQASFLMWRGQDTIQLQLSRDVQPALQKRLSMFVLRAKAKLLDATPSAAFIGVGGAAAQAALRPLFGELPAAPYTHIESAHGTLLRVGDAFGQPRYQWIVGPERLDAALAQLAATLAIGADQAWRLAEIHAGVPQITLKTQEQFVPQMVNFELLGGVNFKKGCYPGQEVVARSQYLGKLKRRMALARIAEANVEAGMEVFDVADPDQPCGMVVNAAANGKDGSDVLVEMKLASLQADVRLGSAGGAPLSFLPMPYALDALDL
jgi:hypothetical protein